MKTLSRFSFFAAVSLISMLALAVFAGASVGGFSVRPIFPENQSPDTEGFFNLMVEPGEQTIMVELLNSTGDDMTAELSLITAGTNSNGIVDYGTQARIDETMLHPFHEIARLGESEVTIPAGGSVVVPVTLYIPEFEGVILGSIHALLGITEEEREQAGMIVNRIAHIVVVRLQQGGIPAPAFELGEVSAETVNHRAAVVIPLRHTSPRLSMGALADAGIYHVDSGTAVFSREDVMVDFAPNAVFPLEMVDRAGYGIAPGDYIARVVLEHEGQVWEFQQEFVVSPAQASAVNQAAVNQQQVPGAVQGGSGFPRFGWVLIGVVGGGLMVVFKRKYE